MADFSWQTLHLLRPACLLLLPVWWALLWWLYHKEETNAAWQRVCDPALLDYLLVGAAVQRVARWWWLLALVGSLLLLAMAGPAWKELAQPVYRQSSALVILLDVSRSMDSQDVQPSRLQQARQKLHDLLTLRQEGQTALIVFAGEAFVVTPLTDDVATIDAQLQSIRTDMMPVQGSQPAKALNKAVALLKQAGVAHGHVFLIGDALPDVNNRAMSMAVEALVNAGHRFSTMSVGTPQGAPIPLPNGGFVKNNKGDIVIPHVNYSRFAQWADVGNGQYQTMRLDNQGITTLQAAWQSSNEQHYKQADTATFSRDQWREDGTWLLLFLLPLVALVFRRGCLLVLLVFYIPHPAEAFDWKNLWLNADQQGWALLQQDQYSQASKHFNDPQWKAASAYQAGDYAQAAKLLEPLKTADAYYNRGNALARAGDTRAAIAAYTACLLIEPKHADAIYNKKLLEEKESQNQKKKPQEKDQQKGKQKKDQQQQGKQGGKQEKQGQKQEANKQNKTNKSTTSQSAMTKKDEQQAMAEQAKKDAKKEKNQQQPATPSAKKPKKKHDTPAEQHTRSDAEVLKKMETRQAYDQFIRRVPDDPGGLLRRKFLYQYQQQQQQHPSSTRQEETW
ncbi:MAG: VWA domain-containing protein [Mariprofundaceae bacterium]|nr:VWA domain-containing protein [Mariprofundaceae bacterium]